MIKLNLGLIYCILYIIFISVSSVWIHTLSKHLHISLMLSGASFFSILFFNAINFKKISYIYKTLFSSIPYWLLLSVSIVLTWFFTYYSYIYGSPRLAQASLYLIVAICSCFFLKYYLKFLICSIILISVYSIISESNFETILSTLCAGICGFAFFKISKIYADKFLLSASQILAIRFYLLFFLSTIYTIYIYKSGAPLVNENIGFTSVISILLILSITNMIITNFLSQASIIALGAEKFSLFVSATPVVTFLFQAIILKDYSNKILLLCLLVCFVLAVPTSKFTLRALR